MFTNLNNVQENNNFNIKVQYPGWISLTTLILAVSIQFK